MFRLESHYWNLCFYNYLFPYSILNTHEYHLKILVESGRVGDTSFTQYTLYLYEFLYFYGPTILIVRRQQWHHLLIWKSEDGAHVEEDRRE
jgi:hypothetical protein